MQKKRSAKKAAGSHTDIEKEEFFTLDDIMMPLFMAKKMVDFVNTHHLTVDQKEMEGLTEEEMKEDMLAVQISFVSKSQKNIQRIIKEIRRLASKHNIYI